MIKTGKITFSYKEYENEDELDSADLELIKAARAVAANAYAPYSRFKVGAAVRLHSGRVVCGANVENAAFPSGICAERNALSTAISNYPDDKPAAISIASFTDDGITSDYPSPCGSCRQVIAEEESRIGSKIRIILSSRNKTVIVESISDLLPLQFNRNNLGFILP